MIPYMRYNFSFATDNAYDPDVLAECLWIDKKAINGVTCLMFMDNGSGLDADRLHRMLS